MVKQDEKTGKWYVKYNYKDHVTGKWKSNFKRGFKLKREAVEYEAKMKTESSEVKEGAVSSSIKFSDVAKLWEDTLESSEVSRRHHAEHFTIRFSDLYDKPIKKITKEQLISWRNELSEKDYSTKTKNTTISYVRSVFRFASDVYGIQNNSIVLRNIKETKEEIMSKMQVWTVEEFNRFAQCVDNEIYRIFFTTLFWTGARRGEIIALQCSDLDEETRTIYIHASQRNMTTGLQPTKTGETRRVQVDNELYEQLLKLKHTYKTGYLFGGSDPLRPTSIDRYFQSGIEISGVKKIRLHDLRHSHATILINSGVNIVAVSKRLGHADINQTLKTYTHLLQDTNEKMMAEIERMKNVL